MLTAISPEINKNLPIDLKNLYGKRFKIGFDPAAQHEEGGKHDPWYYLILCKNGDIYPFSDELLAFHCTKRGIRNRLYKEHPEIEMRNESDDGEAIFIFSVEQFDLVAEHAKPRKKRRLSEKQKQVQVERLRNYRFKSKIDATQVAKSAQISMLEGN